VLAVPPDVAALRALEALDRGSREDPRVLVAAVGDVLLTYLEQVRAARFRTRTPGEIEHLVGGNARDPASLIEVLGAAERAKYSSRAVAQDAAGAAIACAMTWVRAERERAGAAR
jgi:hypothetical protein